MIVTQFCEGLMYSALTVNFLLHPTFCFQPSISNMSAFNTMGFFTRMGWKWVLYAVECGRSVKVTGRIDSSEAWRQGDKPTLARLKSGRWFLFWEYYVTCNNQDVPVLDSHQHLLPLLLGYIGSKTSSEDMAVYWITMHNLSPWQDLIIIKRKPTAPLTM